MVLTVVSESSHKSIGLCAIEMGGENLAASLVWHCGVGKWETVPREVPSPTINRKSLE